MSNPEVIARAIKKYRELTERERSETNLLEFLKGGWPNIDPAPFRSGWHLEAIAEHLQAVTRGQIRRLIINVPPRTSKSSIVSVAWPAWTWAQSACGPLSGPHVQFLSSSYAQTLSMRDSVKTRRLIESPWYQQRWGSRFSLVGDVNTKIRFENSKGGYRLATSVGGALTGEGGDIIICLPYDQKILTESGELEIGYIVENKVKVMVAGWDGGAVSWQDISAYESGTLGSRSYIRIETSNSVLELTNDHPVFIQGKGWVQAGDVKAGDIAVCVLREVGDAPIVSPAEAQNWPILQSLMSHQNQQFWGAKRQLSWGECKKSLCSLRNRFLGQSVAGSDSFVLLPPLSVGQHAAKAANIIGQRLLGLWKNVPSSKAIIEVLLGCVSKCFPWRKITGCQVWLWEAVLPLSTQVEVVDGNHTSPRWPSVFSVRGPKFGSWGHAHPSHRLLQDQYQIRKSHKSLQVLSRDNAWKSTETLLDEVVSVSVSERKDRKVYNLRCDQHHNYFANGILVHNCDDPHNANEVESDLVRTGTLQWWAESMSTRHNDPKTGAYVVIMQRLHQEDLTGYILSKEADNYVHLMLPMRHEMERRCITHVQGIKFWEDPRNSEGELLCPERFSTKEVDDLEVRLGPFGAAGQLQQSPVPRGGGIIKEEWWQRWAEPRYPQCQFMLASLDTAYTEKTENDPSALTIWGVFKDEHGNPKVCLLYGWQERLELHDLVQRVIDTCTVDKRKNVTSKYRFPVDRILIEKAANGISVAHELQRLIGFSGQMGVELLDTRKYGDKWARAYAVQHLFAEKMIYVPWPIDERTKEQRPMPYSWVKEIMDQVTVFPRGAHDDYVDSSTMALRWLRDCGFAVRVEEHAVEVAEELNYRARPKALYPV